MSLRALLYAYVLGGLTFLPLVLFAALCITLYTSVPPPDPAPKPRPVLVDPSDDPPRTRKAWLTVRRAFEESPNDASYVALVKSYLDSRSKDPKRARPKDMWYVVLKSKVLYLYEDEAMTECEAAVELGRHDVLIYPEGLPDGELFTRRNAICLRPRSTSFDEDVVPWFIFVRSCIDMEDWYIALVHASDHPPGTPPLSPLSPVFLPSDMHALVATLDEQPDVIPMRWFNALFGRLFYTFYKTQTLESFIIGRIMKKLSKVKRPAFLSDIAVTHFAVGDKPPTLSKPMLKELTKEGDASIEVGLSYKGEIRATVEATAVINLGARFKSYTVKLVLAVVVRELEGNLLVKVKRPPSSRIWYGFTKTPRMVINVEPIVSDRQITWSMILNTIEAKIEEIIIDSVVLPNMDDISFFDSAEYQHRGGVWADAVRLETPVTTDQPLEEAGPSHLAPESAPSLDSIPIVRSATASSEQTSMAINRRTSLSSGADTEPECEAERGVNGSLTPPPDTSAIPSSDASDNDQDHDYLSTSRSRSSRAHSVSSSIGGDESSTYLSDTSATSKSPRHSLGTTTTASFLSALKSKAGDKQALSNTAKEAMRKWGVWGLKKDVPCPDEFPDMGPSDRPRAESTRGRQSYADMRAAVVEREQSERVHGGSSPVAIPVGRSPSTSRRRMVSYSNGSTSPGLSRSLSSDPFRDRDRPEGMEDAPSLIHTQPSQARTMTIPGIHASHRGEVMCMGNVAPVPPSPESKPKGATIQSMYRLWKSPILTGQPSQEAQGSTSTLPGRGDTSDTNQDVTLLSLTPEAVPPPRAAPPPLPPRTTVRHAESTEDAADASSVSAASQALKAIASRDDTQRRSVDMDNGASGSSVDTGLTTVPTTVKPGHKPPLPPRRIPA